MSSPIRLAKTAFVVYYHADFEAAKTFFLDFGLTIEEESSDSVFFRGYGEEPFVYHLRHSPTDTPSRFGGSGR